MKLDREDFWLAFGFLMFALMILFGKVLGK